MEPGGWAEMLVGLALGLVWAAVWLAVANPPPCLVGVGRPRRGERESASWFRCLIRSALTTWKVRLRRRTSDPCNRAASQQHASSRSFRLEEPVHLIGQHRTLCREHPARCCCPRLSRPTWIELRKHVAERGFVFLRLRGELRGAGGVR